MAEEFELEDEPFDFEDEFDRLRQKTVRTSAVYDEMEFEELEEEEVEGGFFSRISPQQRVILALIALLDVLVITVGLLIVLDII